MSRRARPRLLFLCQTLPYPPDGGVNIRSYHLMRILAEEFDLRALCFYRRVQRPTPEQVAHSLRGLNDVGPTEAFRIHQEYSRGRLLWDHIRSVVLRRTYTVFTYQSTSFRTRIQSLLRSTRFDAVHMESLDLSTYLPDLADLPVVCGHHNIESALLLRRATAERSPFRGRYLRFQAELQEQEERRHAGAVALNLVCSDEDGRLLSRIAPSAKISTVPNGVDTSAFAPSFGGTGGVVFVGGTSWFPNADGMRWFAEEALPHIRARVPDLKVTWVGRASQATMDEYRTKYSIELTGFVPDIRPHVNSASCFVAPIRVGGGTRLKILDAWAMGKAVVSTSVGCEGLLASDGENALVRDEPKAFAEAVLQVVEDKGLSDRLGRAGRATVEEHYDWGVIGRKTIPRYHRLLEHRKRGPT